MATKPITIIKRKVEKILKENGYRKVAMEDFVSGEKTYYRYGGSISFEIGNIYYAFGEDKLMHVLGHICGFGSDCGTSLVDMLFDTFKLHMEGAITEKEIKAKYL